MSQLQQIRRRRFDQQAGICHYCEQPMWHADPVAFARQHSISVKQLRLLRSTAEHCVAVSAGGKDSRSNIVAACFYCNSRRHRSRVALEPEAYKAKVKRRLATGAWHGLRLC